LFLQEFVLIFFGHWPLHSTFVLSDLVTVPFANTVALANKIATTPKLILFILMNFKLLNNNYTDRFSVIWGRSG